MKKKILITFGTRPEAIKMAPLANALYKKPDLYETKICVTGQHREMLDQVLKVFKIQPDVDLNLMKPGQDLFDITSSVLLEMREVLKDLKPDLILVHGDTTTTFSTSIAGFYLNIPVGHVEAGLRTYNLKAPFPEEFNRLVASKIARWHFAPTKRSSNNLLKENIDPNTISITGNTVIDALHWILNNFKKNPTKQEQLLIEFNGLLNFNIKKEKFVLITCHRRENFGKGFTQICEALHDLATFFPNVHFVYPVHLNPNVQNPVYSKLSHLPNILLIDPLDYEPFIFLLSHTHLVLTDSGGIQEEAPSLGKPVIVMRKTTERPEAVEAGTVKLVGSDRKNF